MVRWPLHPAPLDDAPLSSWITRLAAAYEMDPPEFCHAALDWPNPSLQGLDECPPAELITTLADHTGWSISRVEAMTLRHYEGIVFETFALAAPQAMSALLPRFHPDRRHGDDRAHDQRPWRQLTPWLLPRASTAAMPFCPLCLAEGPVVYPRTAWSLALTTVCRQHEVVLRDRCLACAEPVLRFWVRLAPERWVQCGCGAAFAQTPTRPAPAPVLWLTNRAHEALTTGAVVLDDHVPIETGIQALGLWEEPRTWAHGYIRGGVAFRSLTEQMDTTTPHGELLFSVFGALAQYERALTQERIRAGLAAAQRRGRRGGRPHAIQEEKLEAIREALHNGASKAAVCRTFGVKRSTLYDALARGTAAPRQ